MNIQISKVSLNQGLFQNDLRSLGLCKTVMLHTECSPSEIALISDTPLARGTSLYKIILGACDFQLNTPGSSSTCATG